MKEYPLRGYAVTSSPREYIFLSYLLMIFYIWCEIEAVMNMLEIKNVHHFEVAADI